LFLLLPLFLFAFLQIDVALSAQPTYTLILEMNLVFANTPGYVSSETTERYLRAQS
jgi:hypothetical protein